MLSEEQKALRRTGIGGSEAAAVVGLNPHRRLIDVWQAKMGLAEDVEETFHIERGNMLEPALRAWYSKRTGREVRETTTLRHPKYPHVLATPDGIVIENGAPSRALELKSPGRFTAGDWGEPGTDDVPKYYLPQLMFECAVLDVQLADAAPLINDDLAIFTVKFDPDFFGYVAEACEKFWRDHIETGVPPDPDGSESYAEYIKSKFARSGANVLPRSGLTDTLAEQLKEWRAARKSAEAIEERIAQQLQLAIGSAAGIETELGVITWKTKAGSPRWKDIATAAGATQQLIDAHTPTTGARVFSVPRSWDKEPTK